MAVVYTNKNNDGIITWQVYSIVPLLEAISALIGNDFNIL
jgi:hypothetical protein